MRMRSGLSAMLGLVGSISATIASAQMQGGPIPTPALPGAIALLPSGSTATTGEIWEQRGPGDRSVRNVSTPTLTPFLPDPAKATGAAVIVAPGGAFHILSYDNEGTAVARWLAGHGIAAFLLKYRTIQTGADQKSFNTAISAYMKAGIESQKFDTPPEALADAQAAVRLVRARAAQWKVDPVRVGFVGFSAGAMTTLSVGLTDDKGARPDFIAPIYPPMTARDVPADAPPMFLAIALDDPLFGAGRPLTLIESWRGAKRPLEVHLYEKGSHGFGMANWSAGSALWIDEFYAWMKDRRIVKAEP